MSREYKVVVKSVDSGTKLVWVLILFHLSVNSLSVVEASDKGGPLEKGMAKPLQYSCLENPMNSMKRQKYMTQKDEPPPGQ